LDKAFYYFSYTALIYCSQNCSFPLLIFKHWAHEQYYPRKYQKRFERFFCFLELEGQTTEEKGSVFAEKVMEGPL
jgi:hypothetical protein